MKHTQSKLRHTVMMGLLAMLVSLPLGAGAQIGVTNPQSEHQYNDDIHTFIIKRLRQNVQQREKQMNKQIQQMLINLPNNEKLYDETFVRIATAVQEDTTEDGKPEINYVYNITYNCHHFEGTEDDYPSGAYLWTTSNSCRAICNLTKTMIDEELSDIFSAGLKTTITVTSTTDAAEIAHIDYKGEYGDFRYMPAIFNDENVRISVDKKDGITTNAQLAYTRAQSVHSYLQENVNSLKRTDNEYLYVTRCFDMTGPHYRRSSIQIVVHGAFDAAAKSMEAALLNDEYVDFNIPSIEENINSKTYALIIADEEYTAPLPNCDFASNDGDVLHEYFTAHPDVKLVVMFNSRVYMLGDYLLRHPDSARRVVAFDDLDGNFDLMRKGGVTVLICQRTEDQAVRSLTALANSVIMHSLPPERDNYVHMEILTRYNIDNY